MSNEVKAKQILMTKFNYSDNFQKINEPLWTDEQGKGDNFQVELIKNKEKCPLFKNDPQKWLTLGKKNILC